MGRGGTIGDWMLVSCFGGCSAGVPEGRYFFYFRTYMKNQCKLCNQWFYLHHRPVWHKRHDTLGTCIIAPHWSHVLQTLVSKARKTCD
eukprot:gene468-biopygen9091